MFRFFSLATFVLTTTCLIGKSDQLEFNIQASYDSARKYMISNPARAMAEADLILSQDIDGIWQGKIYYLKGFIQHYDERYIEAIRNTYEAIIAFNEEGDLRRLANSYFLLGRIYFANYNDPLALEAYLKCRDVGMKLKEYRYLADVTYNIGMCYSEMNDLATGKYELFNALKLYSDSNNKRTGKVLSALGLLNYKAGNDQEAMSYFRQSIKILETSKNNDWELADAYNKVGYALMEKNDFDSAEFYLKRSILLNEITSESDLIPIPIYNLADLYFRAENYAESIKYFEKTAYLADSLSDNGNLLDALIQLRQAYFKIGDEEEAKKVADRYGKAAKKIAKKNEELHKISSQYQVALIHEKYQQRLMKAKTDAYWTKTYFITLGIIFLIALFFFRREIKKSAALKSIRSILQEE